MAPYAYHLEDVTHKLTYEKVARFPLDSFRPINRAKAIQLGVRHGTVWLKLRVDNQINSELFLYSSVWKYSRMDVFVVDRDGQVFQAKGESKIPFQRRLAPIAQTFVSIGNRPQMVYLALAFNGHEFMNDYLQVTTMGGAMGYLKVTTFWQGGLEAVYLLTFLFALVFFIRLRDPLIGWYALFVYVNAHWFLDRSGYLFEIFGQNSWYTHFRAYYPLHLIFSVLWCTFLLKLTRLWTYSRVLYYLIIGMVCIDTADYLFTVFNGITGGQYYGQFYTPLRRLLHWLGIEYIGFLAILHCLNLFSVIYVTKRDFRRVRWYALAFGIGLVSMIIGMLALYEIPWLPYIPFNNTYFVGSVVEIIILGYMLAERVNEQRRQQHQTQQALIAQLQENLRQRDKLLRIRDEIARDLHDEVGATLTSIAISTKLVQKKVNGRQPEIQPILDQIKADSEDTIHSIRDTVWALNPDNDAPERFLERLRSVALQLLTNQGIALAFDCVIKPADLPPFSMEQRRNLYLVFKEAIHNIVKHAQANCVSIQIHRQASQLQIIITDDGRGFDLTAQSEGNGLVNFRKRAAAGGFSVEVESGAGTVVSILVPVSNIAEQIGITLFRAMPLAAQTVR
ncbi:hypothetical protein GCM10023187_08050 [Nibrella viscosa]|uniref:histidine kinase n=1 Tax=Nibrella viscosa TaxID=1084524 RepID=A0ABP8JZI3_9BACT